MKGRIEIIEEGIVDQNTLQVGDEFIIYIDEWGLSGSPYRCLKWDISPSGLRRLHYGNDEGYYNTKCMLGEEKCKITYKRPRSFWEKIFGYNG